MEKYCNWNEFYLFIIALTAIFFYVPGAIKDFGVKIYFF